MEQNFNFSIAMEYGLLEAIIIRHLQLCLIEQKVQRNKDIIIHTTPCDKRVWERYDKNIYNCFFGYADESEIDNAISHLVNEEVLLQKSDNDFECYLTFADEEKWLAI